jgi:hypothetical protein
VISKFPGLLSLHLFGETELEEGSKRVRDLLVQIAKKPSLGHLYLSNIFSSAVSSSVFQEFCQKKDKSHLGLCSLPKKAFEEVTSFGNLASLNVKILTGVEHRVPAPLPKHFASFLTKLEKFTLTDFIFTVESLMQFKNALLKASSLEILRLKGCSLPMTQRDFSGLPWLYHQLGLKTLELEQFLAPDTFYLELVDLAVTRSSFTNVCILNDYDQNRKFGKCFDSAKTRSYSLCYVRGTEENDRFKDFKPWLLHNRHINRIWRRSLIIHHYKKIMQKASSPIADMNVLKIIISFLQEDECTCSGRIPFMDALETTVPKKDDASKCVIS